MVPDATHTLEVLDLCPQLHESRRSCYEQNGNGLSGEAAGLLGVLPNNVRKLQQNGDRLLEAKGVKRCGGRVGEGVSPVPVDGLIKSDLWTALVGCWLTLIYYHFPKMTNMFEFSFFLRLHSLVHPPPSMFNDILVYFEMHLC